MWCIREGRTRGVAPAPRRGPVPKPPRSPLAAFGQNIQTYPRRAAFCRTPRAASLSPMPFVEVGVATAAPRIAACRCWLSAATPLLGLEQCCSAWSGLAQLQRERAHRFVLASTHAPGAVRPGTTHLARHIYSSKPPGCSSRSAAGTSSAQVGYRLQSAQVERGQQPAPFPLRRLPPLRCERLPRC